MFHSKIYRSPDCLTYSTRRVDDIEDGLSIRSHMSTTTDRYSNATGSSKRINAIKPKNKIVFSPAVQHPHDTLTLPRSSQASISKSLKDCVENIDPKHREPAKSESLNYNTLKPLFSFNPISFFCRGETNGLGSKGCLCKYPCQLRINWCKHTRGKDLVMFRKLLDLPVKPSDSYQIDKDIYRTHTYCQTFSHNVLYQQMLKYILLAYSVYDYEVGYVQGMNKIVGVLLYHIKNSQYTFWAFVDLMEEQEFRMIYLDNFKRLRQHCVNIVDLLYRKVNDLYRHMQSINVAAEVFLHGWLLALMGNCIPLEHMHAVVEKFRKDGWRFIYRLVITYLLCMKYQLMTAADDGEFLCLLNTQNSRDFGAEWVNVIHNADSLRL